MSECVTIRTINEVVKFTMLREAVRATVYQNSLEGCSSSFSVGTVNVEATVTSNTEFKVNKTARVQVNAYPAVPRTGDVFWSLDEDEDPCDLILSKPAFVLKKVVVDGCTKFKLLVVEPAP